MAKIPQLIFYLTKFGTISCEVPAPNGARRKLELPQNSSEWGELIHAELISQDIEIRDAEALENSLKLQKRNESRATHFHGGITREHVLNQSPSYSEKIDGVKIKLYNINNGGIALTLNNKIVKTDDLQFIARFTSRAYAIRAAQKIINANPELIQPKLELVKTRKNSVTKTKPLTPVDPRVLASINIDELD